MLNFCIALIDIESVALAGWLIIKPCCRQLFIVADRCGYSEKRQMTKLCKNLAGAIVCTGHWWPEDCHIMV
jgi:hypothetical protein